MSSNPGTRCWMDIFSKLICWIICIACLKKTKNKRKRGRGWSIFYIKASIIPTQTTSPPVGHIFHRTRINVIRCRIPHLPFLKQINVIMQLTRSSSRPRGIWSSESLSTGTTFIKMMCLSCFVLWSIPGFSSLFFQYICHKKVAISSI